VLPDQTEDFEATTPSRPRERIALRRRAAEINLPVSDRLRMRVGRALENALKTPRQSTPGLRRAIVLVAQELRAQGFTEEGIAARVAMLVQSVALARGLDTRSLVTGQSRSQELTERVVEWIAADAQP
jgi:hypothetical protein